MDAYPQHIIHSPKPLVFLIGNVDTDPDLHHNFTKYYRTSVEADGKESPLLLLQSVDNDFAFREKKPPKDFLSTEGIVKEDWAPKYATHIPSVVVYFTPLNLDWSNSEKQKRETLFGDKLQRIKAALSFRETKVIVIMVRIGAGASEKETLDERILAYRRTGSLDSKSFFYFSSADFSIETSTAKRVFKYMKEFAYLFYGYHIKRFKALEKALVEKYKGPMENVLRARLNFKIAFLNEFIDQQHYSLRHYRNSFSFLVTALGLVDDGWFGQIKIVAEFCHFKICSMLLSKMQVEDAVQQLKTHLSAFVFLRNIRTWHHYAWIARQYLVFCQLLDQYGVAESLQGAERVYYLENVGRYNKLRLEAFVSKPSHSKSINEKRKQLIMLPPRFVGAVPVFLDPKTDQICGSEVSSDLHSDYLEEEEAKVDHLVMISQYFKQALDRVPPNRERRSVFISLQLADLYLQHKQRDSALAVFWSAIRWFLREKWIGPLVVLLRSTLSTALALGEVMHYIRAGFLLYSALVSTGETSEAIPLHNELFSLLLRKQLVVNLENGTTTKSHIVEKLPKDLMLVVKSSFINLFEVRTSFDRSTVIFGDRVLVIVTLISKFAQPVSFDRMIIRLIDNSEVFQFYHSTSVSDKDGVPCDLNFVENLPKEFSFEIHVVEEKFNKFLGVDKVITVDSIDLLCIKEQQSPLFTFHLSSLPDDVLQIASGTVDFTGDVLHRSPALMNQSIHWRELFYFTPRVDRANYLVLMKPKDLLKMVAWEEEPYVFQDLLQRVDFKFESTATLLENLRFYVTIESTSIDMENLLWLPEFGNSGSPTKDFKPIILQSSPPHITMTTRLTISHGKVLTLPLYFRAVDLAPISIKISVEFFARSIMRTSLVEDFYVKLGVKPAFAFSYAHTTEFQIGSFIESQAVPVVNSYDLIKTGTLKIKCSSSHDHQLTFQTASHLTQSSGGREELGFKCSELKLDEELLVNYSSSLLGQLEDSKNKIISLHWLVKELRLDFPDHLLQEFYKEVSEKIRSPENFYNEAISRFHFPSVMSNRSHMTVSLAFPSVWQIDKEVKLLVRLKNGSFLNQKCSINVLLTDSLLMEGGTFLNIEVKASGEEFIAYHFIALRAGWLHLPRFVCKFEKSSDLTEEILDTGEKDHERLMIFVIPRENS